MRRVNRDERNVWGKPVPVGQSQTQTGSGASLHHCSLRKLALLILCYVEYRVRVGLLCDIYHL